MNESIPTSEIARHSYLSWMFSALGPFYAVVLPLLGIVVFVGACLVVALNRRPSVIAAYLVFLPAPLLLGVFASIQGFIAAYAVIAASNTPRPSDIAAGISTGLFTALVGVAVSFPAYAVIACGLFLRTLAWRDDSPRGADPDIKL